MNAVELLGEVLVITAAAGVGGTGLGGLTACLFRRDSSRAVSLLLSFAAGVMTAVVCFDLLADAVSPEGGQLFLAVPGILLGCAVTSSLNAWIGRRSGTGHGLFLAGLVMAAAIALHNVPEGMVIGTSFARGAVHPATARSGIMMAVVIGLHNIPEGMAVAVPLISGGMGRARAAGAAALTGAPTVLGALLGFCLGTLGPTSLTLALSFASGAMLYVVFGELLPESALMWRSKAPALAAVLGIITGMVIVYA
ncbi:ZIP family metal transporter [uncultured Oscillibacter sp.]|uniref:ZIP family metal transporter n=1 Tax=uncultured Oscillibacter sp. TaxID=876091 RepID=UPI0026E282AA|nr:ZIP family metal transporter [uncultured Oscillibacter sp.]